MKHVILTTVADDDGKGFDLMMATFNHLCFIKNYHGEVEEGGRRCFVDCNEETAFEAASYLAEIGQNLRLDINKLLIREYED